jgi:hypothetical protein
MHTARCLPLLIALLLPLARASAAPRWNPTTTRVFCVSMTRFKGDVAAPWGTKDRLDHDLIRLFRARGVPPDHIVMLTDERAETREVKRAFTEFLASSRPADTLIFDFSSHGGYDPKTDAYVYSTYDGELPFEWFFDAIEGGFHGARVLMLADCCYSGGIVEIARRRHPRIALACLATTRAHDVGYSGWRFFDCLIRGFGGNPVVDLNGDGQVDLDELARFTRRHLEFVAEEQPQFSVSGGFDPRFVLAVDRGPRKPVPIGEYVKALHEGTWRKAEIVDARPSAVRVHFTDPNMNETAWLPSDQIRRTLRGGFGGSWVGTFHNSAGQTGEDSLVLIEDAAGNLDGTWSGDVSLQGRRVDATTAELSGQTASRAYTVLARLERGVLTLRYRARRIDSGGAYDGRVTLEPAR